MEFSTKKSDLLKELDLTQNVVEKKTTIPILSNLLLEVADSSLQLSATDLELGVRCGCAAKVKTGGSGTVPARRLLDVLRSSWWEWPRTISRCCLPCLRLKRRFQLESSPA